MFHLQHFPADTYIWGVGGCYIYYIDICNYSILRKSSSKAQTAACLLMILAVAERGGIPFHGYFAFPHFADVCDATDSQPIVII